MLLRGKGRGSVKVVLKKVLEADVDPEISTRRSDSGKSSCNFSEKATSVRGGGGVEVA